MKLKRFISIALLFFIVQSVTAQNRPEFFKVVPQLSGTEPTWVSEMYREFQLYPNPSTGLFFVGFKAFDSLQLEIVDNNGKLVYSNRELRNGQAVDLSIMADGIYFYSFYNGVEKVEGGKIVKQ